MTAVRQLTAVESDGLTLSLGACMPGAPRAAVLLLHGIPSTASPEPDDEGYPGLARWFASEGFAAMWADMRAARGAPGYFSIKGWARDARTLIDAARSMDGLRDVPLAVVGSSAGGAVALYAAGHGAPVDAVVALAAPAEWLSFAADPEAGVRRIVGEAGMPLSDETLADPSPWAAEFAEVTALQSIGRVTVPVLLVHGAADDVVPVEHARMLAARAPQAELRILEGRPHKLRRDAETMQIVQDFLRRVLT